MARLPGAGLAGKKAKLGTTIRESSLDLLTAYREKRPDELRSPGEAVDYLVATFLDIDGQMAAEFCDFCRVKGKEIQDELRSMPGDELMRRAELQQRAVKYSVIEAHMFAIADKSLVGTAKDPMQRVDMADGAYAVFPETWLVLNPNEAKDCSFAGVIEVKGGAAFNAPHIVFFNRQPVPEMDSRDASALYAKAANVWPEMQEVLSRQVDPAYDSSGNMINEEEWAAAPRVSAFGIKDASLFVNASDAPYGAVVYR